DHRNWPESYRRRHLENRSTISFRTRHHARVRTTGGDLALDPDSKRCTERSHAKSRLQSRHTRAQRVPQFPEFDGTRQMGGCGSAPLGLESGETTPYEVCPPSPANQNQPMAVSLEDLAGGPIQLAQKLIEQFRKTGPV